MGPETLKVDAEQLAADAEQLAAEVGDEPTVEVPESADDEGAARRYLAQLWPLAHTEKRG